MDAAFFKEIKDELQKGAHEKNHPFRYGTLATIGLETMPRQRIVVLREVTEHLKLVFFTDKRSKKLIHIKENNKVSMLFYHPKEMLQIKVEGLATIIKDEQAVEKYWKNVPLHSRKEYTTQNSPGSAVEAPDALEYLTTENHFCIIEIEAFRIEYLKLKRPNHIRIQFTKTNNQWSGEFLVP